MFQIFQRIIDFIQGLFWLLNFKQYWICMLLLFFFFFPISPDSKVDNPNMTGKSNKTESCCKISWFLQNISQWNAIDSMHIKKKKNE